MELKFSKRLKEVVAISREESIRLGQGFIGVEHLLMGMLKEGDGMAVSILKKLGVLCSNWSTFNLNHMT